MGLVGTKVMDDTARHFVEDYVGREVLVTHVDFHISLPVRQAAGVGHMIAELVHA